MVTVLNSLCTSSHFGIKSFIYSTNYYWMLHTMAGAVLSIHNISVKQEKQISAFKEIIFQQSPCGFLHSTFKLLYNIMYLSLRGSRQIRSFSSWLILLIVSEVLTNAYARLCLWWFWLSRCGLGGFKHLHVFKVLPGILKCS